MNKLKVFVKSIDETFSMLKTNEKFRDKFKALIDLAKSPLVQAFLGDSVNIDLIESVLKSILTDERISNVVNVISNIFECFSADRFIPVKTEKELEDLAFDMNDKKMFMAGVYFNDESNENEFSYKLRMDIDNTPITLENKNRFWFPGPLSSFELDMRYHRGFIQIQHSLDLAIIKREKKNQTIFEEEIEMEEEEEEEKFLTTILPTDIPVTTQIPESLTIKENSTLFDYLYDNIGKEVNVTETKLKFAEDGINLEDFLDFKDDPPEFEVKNRSKRQFDGLLGLLFGGDGPKETKVKEVKFLLDDLKFFTKQFPYPKYMKDE